jgi:hypothetical protein
MKKNKFPVIKTVKCSRCDYETPHSLVDENKGIYRCNFCKTLKVVKN